MIEFSAILNNYTIIFKIDNKTAADDIGIFYNGKLTRKSDLLPFISFLCIYSPRLTLFTHKLLFTVHGMVIIYMC